MAKGDNERLRTEVDYQKANAQNRLDNLWDGMHADTSEARDRFRGAYSQNQADYGNIMSRFQNFADTGGFTPQEESALRARAIAPTRAVYSNALRNVSRQRSLQGGMSPGYGTLMSRFAREQSQSADDASLNAEATLAEMKNRNKLAGMQGMTNAYGTTPGMSALTGSMFNQASNNLINLQGLQQNLANMAIQGKAATAQIPGKWQQGFSNVLGGAAKIGGIIAGLGGIPWGGAASSALDSGALQGYNPDTGTGGRYY